LALILLVDDDPDQLEIRRLLLETSGFEVRTASTAGEAERLFTDCPPALVVTDLRLPSPSDGIRLMRIMRARSASVPILVLSGMTSDLARVEDGLADEVLQKPFRPDRFLELVHEYAHGSR
jgi:DNA-binding response OmpR family regulator